MSNQTNAQLADVNVFLALLWPRQVHHKAAQAWFASQGHRNWATNSLTGHRRWTDLLLLRQAAERKRKMVTFDKALHELAPKESRSNLLILDA